MPEIHSLQFKVEKKKTIRCQWLHGRKKINQKKSLDEVEVCCWGLVMHSATNLGEI